jgi:glutathione S-transferase
VALAQSGLAFETVMISLDLPTTRAEIKKVNPAGKLPVLHHDGLVIWDSLAICEYANELAPAAQLWPADRAQRAKARAVCAEMHSGFAALRQNMSMDLVVDHRGEGHTPEALADAARVMDIWREALGASGGPFLFGAFGAADAMYAPVVSRFRTYAVAVGERARAYMNAVMALPAWREWKEAALKEPWVLSFDEPDWPTVLREGGD